MSVEILESEGFNNINKKSKAKEIVNFAVFASHIITAAFFHTNARYAVFMTLALNIIFGHLLRLIKQMFDTIKRALIPKEVNVPSLSEIGTQRF